MRARTARLAAYRQGAHGRRQNHRRSRAAGSGVRGRGWSYSREIRPHTHALYMAIAVLTDRAAARLPFAAGEGDHETRLSPITDVQDHHRTSRQYPFISPAARFAHTQCNGKAANQDEKPTPTDFSPRDRPITCPQAPGRGRAGWPIRWRSAGFCPSTASAAAVPAAAYPGRAPRRRRGNAAP